MSSRSSLSSGGGHKLLHVNSTVDFIRQGLVVILILKLGRSGFGNMDKISLKVNI